jgi:two-component system cell cycle sensor histidine kinase/response regulator CckA
VTDGSPSLPSPALLADRLFADRATALLLLDPRFHISRANDAAVQVFGAACESGAAAADLFPLSDRPAVRDLLAKARDGGPDAPACVIGRLLVSLEALDAADGRGWLLRAIDLARLRAYDPEQTQAGKLQALGLLAGGVAHDFNNLLTAVQGAAEAALARAGAEPVRDVTLIEDLRTIQDGADRGRDLVRHLLAFGRQQTLQPRVITANQAVAGLSRLLGRLLGGHVRLDLDLEEPARMVRIDPGQLDQVLINLAVNARNAMPEGGTLTLRTGHATLLRPTSASEAEGAEMVPPGRYVTISVADTGGGIAPDVLPNIFDPFFTTRRGQGGSGLGLASVHGIMRQSNGYVGVASTPGAGTCFTLYLPRYVGQAPGATTAPVSAAVQGQVLLVEDEAPVRRLAVRTLRQRGLAVIDSPSAEAALDHLERESGWDELAAIVSDVMLPGVDGPGLVAAVRRRRPGLPAILVSGYADAPRRAALAAEGISFLAKPYSQKTLAESVVDLLLRAPGTGPNG